ncbi:hypothetical protein YC2023_085181 [Brassica napus]
MESEIVVEAFMNFRTHTRFIICNGASSSSISDLPNCFHWVVKAEAKLVVKAKLSRVSAAVVHLLREDTKEDI